jgi:uncharacterized protein YbjT (DUF2867 family)
MITIMAATGRVGKRITEHLLRSGEQVRALGRSRAKLQELEKAGAETLAGEASDAVFLADAFRGAEAVYTLLPYDLQENDYGAQQNQVGEAIARAVQASGVRHLVFLSSVGADLSSGTGMLVSLHAQEERLRRLTGVNVLILRPGPFFENLYGQLDLIRHQGIASDAFAPDLKLPMIATRDIADFAAKALKARDWIGFEVRELLGQRDISFAETTHVLGQRIGKPDLQYVQSSYGEIIEALTDFGFSENIARLEVEVARAANEGRIRSHEIRGPKNTTPTSFEEFADELAHLYLTAQEPLGMRF